MDVTPLVREGSKIIQSYADGRFRISGVLVEGAVLVTQSSLQGWAVGDDVKSLSVDDFAPILDMTGDLDVVLLGTGSRLTFLEPSLRAALKQKGLHIDMMDSGAACRTYNVLMAEGRRVLAALLPYRPS